MSKADYSFHGVVVEILRLPEDSSVECANCKARAEYFVGVGANSLFDEPLLHNKVVCERCLFQLHHGDQDIHTGIVIIDPLLEMLNEIDPMDSSLNLMED